MKKFCAFIALLALPFATFAASDAGPPKSVDFALRETYSVAAPPIIPATYIFQEPPKPAPIEQSWFYDFKAKDSNLVAIGKIGELSKRGKYIADIVAFTGTSNVPLAGFALTGRVSLADQLLLFGGVGGIFRQGEIPQFGGLIVGFRYEAR